MSMNIRLFPCHVSNPENMNGRYYSEIVFELSSWCFVLKDIIENSKPITFPVEIPWVNKSERRSVDELDTGCTWLVEAWVLQSLKFHNDSWHPEQIIRSKAISAYFRELPPDWPVIVYYV